MESLLIDRCYGAKKIWKCKGLSAVAILSLPIGIGANSAIFSIVDSMLFRTRPLRRRRSSSRAEPGAHWDPRGRETALTHQRQC